MLGAVLLLLVILNAFLTGWLLASFLPVRRSVTQLSREQEGFSDDLDDLNQRFERYVSFRMVGGGDE